MPDGVAMTQHVQGTVAPLVNQTRPAPSVENEEKLPRAPIRASKPSCGYGWWVGGGSQGGRGKVLGGTQGAWGKGDVGGRMHMGGEVGGRKCFTRLGYSWCILSGLFCGDKVLFPLGFTG